MQHRLLILCGFGCFFMHFPTELVLHGKMQVMSANFHDCVSHNFRNLLENHLIHHCAFVYILSSWILLFWRVLPSNGSQCNCPAWLLAPLGKKTKIFFFKRCSCSTMENPFHEAFWAMFLSRIWRPHEGLKWLQKVVKYRLELEGDQSN